MQDLISGRRILPAVAAAIIFYIAFEATTPYFIQDHIATPHAVDAHAMKTGCFFDTAFVIKAKERGYNHARFFKSWFLLDCIFPLVYSLLFLSCAALYRSNKHDAASMRRHRRVYRVSVCMIIACACFDYCENFSFAIFLLSASNTWAMPVAVFTAIKSILFSVNIIVAIVYVCWALSHKKIQRA